MTLALQMFTKQEAELRWSEFWTGALAGYYEAKGGRYGDCRTTGDGDCPIDEALWQEAIAYATALADKRVPGVDHGR